MRGLPLVASMLLLGCYTYAGVIVVDEAAASATRTVVASVVEELGMEPVRDEFPGMLSEFGGKQYETVGIYRLHSPKDAPDESFDLFVKLERNGDSALVLIRDFERSSASDYVLAVQARFVSELSKHIPPERITVEHNKIRIFYAP